MYLRCVSFPSGLGTAITNPSMLDACNTGLFSSARNRGDVSSFSPVSIKETLAVVPFKSNIYECFKGLLMYIHVLLMSWQYN